MAQGAEVFRMAGQVAGSVPYADLLFKGKNDLPVPARGGGFGDDTTRVDVFRFIEEKASE